MRWVRSARRESRTGGGAMPVAVEDDPKRERMEA